MKLKELIQPEIKPKMSEIPNVVSHAKKKDAITIPMWVALTSKNALKRVIRQLSGTRSSDFKEDAIKALKFLEGKINSKI